MKFIKRVDFEQSIMPAHFFYERQLLPFRRLSSTRINIEGSYYNFWRFTTKHLDRYFIAAFPVENVNHLLLFETTKNYNYVRHSREYKLKEFDIIY